MPEHDEYVAGVGDEQGLRLAERLMSRFTVTNSEEIFELINKKAYNGGILIMLIVLCWWVLITEGGDDVELATSFLFNLNYLNVAITVGLFGLISSGLTSIAKEKGQLVNSLVSGAMLIVCGFFIIEPLFYGITGDEINAQVGLWRSSRRPHGPLAHWRLPGMIVRAMGRVKLCNRKACDSAQAAAAQSSVL